VPLILEYPSIKKRGGILRVLVPSLLHVSLTIGLKSFPRPTLRAQSFERKLWRSGKSCFTSNASLGPFPVILQSSILYPQSSAFTPLSPHNVLPTAFSYRFALCPLLYSLNTVSSTYCLLPTACYLSPSALCLLLTGRCILPTVFLFSCSVPVSVCSASRSPVVSGL